MIALPEYVFIAFQTDPPAPLELHTETIGPLALIWPSAFIAQQWCKRQGHDKVVIEKAPGTLLIEDLELAGFVGFAYDIDPGAPAPTPEQIMIFWKPGKFELRYKQATS